MILGQSFGLLLLVRSFSQWNSLSMAQPRLYLGRVMITAALWLGSPVEISTSFGVKGER